MKAHSSYLLYTAWMKPGFIAMRNIKANIIALEHFRSPQATVATINTLVSSTAFKRQNLRRQTGDMPISGC